MEDKVSIIIPCYNECETIVALLDAIGTQKISPYVLEVIVADGLSEDCSREVIEKYAADHPSLDLHVIDNPKRIIPAALNAAIACSTGDFVIRLDAHSVPYEDYVVRCIETIKRTGAANVGGRWEIRPGGETSIALAIAVAASHQIGAGGVLYRSRSAFEPRAVDTVPFGAFRREWLKKVGPFNEKLPVNEDYEYNQRIRQSGGVVWFDPDICSNYYARSTIVALSRQYARYGYWKARMLLLFPKSLRWRQVIPPLFALVAILLAVLALISPLAILPLKAQIIIYTTVLLVAGGIEGIRRHNWVLAVEFPIAIAVMHISWGLGFLWSMLSAVIEKIVRRYELV